MTPLSLGIFASANTTVGTSFESIATVTVGSGGAANAEFTNIPGTYTHLQLRFLGRTNFNDSGLDNPWLRLNGDTGSNYNAHRLYGTGSAAASDAFSTTHIRAGFVPMLNSAANIFGIGVIDILDYANTNKNKTVRLLSGTDENGSGYIGFQSGLWRNTNAITSLTLSPSAGSWVQYSHFALYGIKGPA